MDVDYEIDLEEIQARWQDYDEWNQLILKWPGDDVEIISKAPASGIWRMDENGKIGFVRRTLDWTNVTGENEAFYMRVYTAGDYRYHGADMGILVARGRMQTDDRKLHERCEALGRRHQRPVPMRARGAGSPGAYPGPDDGA